MAFDGTEGGSITLSAGAALTAEYRKQNPNGIKAHFFGKDILNDLLDQQGCMGIRIYYGLDESGVQKLVLVGANSSEEDMTNLVVDLSSACPNICDPSSSLNS